MTNEEMISRIDAIKLLSVSSMTIDRYSKKGKLRSVKKPTTKGSKKFKTYFYKKEVMKMYNKLQENKEKHRPDQFETHKLEAPKKNEAEIIKLDKFGTQILINTKKHIDRIGIAENVSNDAVLRYVVAVQQYEINLAQAYEDHDCRQMAKMYFDTIKHYEQQLGMTPLGLKKLGLLDLEKKDIDPMETFLSES